MSTEKNRQSAIRKKVKVKFSRYRPMWPRGWVEV